MFKGTTIVAVRSKSGVAIAGDGQVTLGHTVMKHGACKLRRMHNNTIIGGFAGSTADAFTLFEKFETKLQEFQGQLARAAVALAKEWRSDRVLRKLEALLLVADKEKTLIISGVGDVIEPDDGVTAIGSGGTYAQAAARALLRNTDMNPADIASEAMKIAAETCIYTNEHISMETL